MIILPSLKRKYNINKNHRETYESFKNYFLKYPKTSKRNISITVEVLWDTGIKSQHIYHNLRGKDLYDAIMLDIYEFYELNIVPIEVKNIAIINIQDNTDKFTSNDILKVMKTAEEHWLFLDEDTVEEYKQYYNNLPISLQKIYKEVTRMLQDTKSNSMCDV